MIDIYPDPTWLDIPEIETLRSLAGTLLAAGLIATVAAVAVGAVLWGAHRLGLRTLSDKGLQLLGRAVGASIALGALSGIVGFGARLMVI